MYGRREEETKKVVREDEKERVMRLERQWSQECIVVRG